MRKFLILILMILISTPALAAESKMGISALMSSPLTIIFIGINIYLTIYFAFYKFDRFAVVHGPEILTTVGIFGCFISIACALLEFNSADLSVGVPTLLDGIKTAFCASVSGVAGALVIRFRHQRTKLPIPQSEGASKAASIDDLVGAILGLQKGLVGNEEGTLLSQMKLLRQDTNDQLQKLQKSFDNFASHMVENNQKALIEALKEVIKDFNQKLTEQFGENFKQLNVAVERLVVWQQQYKDELDTLKLYQTQTANDMQTASNAFRALIERSEKFSSIAEDLKDLLDATDKQKDVLFIQEKALSELLFQMKDITPQFSQKLSTMLDEISNGVKKVQSETVEIVKNFGAQSQSANAEMKNLLTEVIKKTQQELSEGLQANSKIIKDGVLALDKGLQKELNDALSSLGKQLASLSEKFVKDYLPLTERLRDVVRLASNM